MENDNGCVTISVAGENNLYLLNVLEGICIQSNLEVHSQAANGYGVLIDTDGKHELVAIYGFNQTVYFFYRKSYRIDNPDLSIVEKDGIFKSKFQLFLNGNKEIDIKYKQIDIENDIFLDLKDWLEVKPREKLISMLSKQAEFFSETDFAKRADLKWQKEIFSK